MTWRPALVPWLDPPAGTYERASIEGLAFSADGRHLLVELQPHVNVYTTGDWQYAGSCERPIGAAAGDGTVLVGRRASEAPYRIQLSVRRPAPNGELVRVIGDVEYCNGVSCAADGSLAAVVGFGNVELWDLNEARQRAVLDTGPGYASADLAPDGRLLVTRSHDGAAVWDTATGQRVAELPGLHGRMAFSPDGRCFAAGVEQSLGLWRTSDLSLRLLNTGVPQCSPAWSVDGTMLASAGEDGRVRVWPMDCEAAPVELGGSGASVLAFSPDGRTLAAGGGQHVQLWQQDDTADAAVHEPDPRVWQPAWEPLLVPVATAAEHPLWPAPSADEFIEALAAVPWFRRIGQPSPWDDGCTRLPGWSDWPGPESEEGALLQDEQRWVDAVDRYRRTFGRSDVADLDRRVWADVVDMVEAAVPVPADDPYYNPDDHYYPQNTCRAHAAVLAAVIACFLKLGWRVPADLEERWAWFAPGYWPCGYAFQDRVHEPPFRLLVF